MNLTNGRRLLLVHAHPDDESIGTGATMAKYAAEGAQVTLVTCTLGELGEIIPPDLAHLAWDKDNTLGEYRIGELAAACDALGVKDHRFLGGPGHWHDSGMMGTPSNDWEGAFWRADLDEAAGLLARIIEDVRPQVLVTYDSNGFYGHPDHIQTHRVAWRAFEMSDGLVHKFYATAIPKSVLAEGMKLVREARAGEDGESAEPAGSGGAAASEFETVESVDDLPFGVPDEQVTTMIDAMDYLDAKIAAMRAHASQIAVDSPFFALSNGVGQRAFGREYYTLLAGSRGKGGGPHEWESDLFAGID
ncbi:MAG TPA: N-acetyl-1-D-myo-inositol-2-amino-2-deoxy-alpha-D-glucopyranoside deacetylase [Streptosporangiaceae bacterium]|jgi:N-acetyl-1-D-myo-inositol-2-amino-2-deoxy-alpha-D-glucopyranoside deacetylase|nr:N-acetyl-1-D-myo-inositol-2-amino-2-deoxy-alpha-D-glucopyranoside deacetylase [Streptosporangiaceae bacterium]